MKRTNFSEILRNIVDHLISARRPDLMIVNKKGKTEGKAKREINTCTLLDN